MSTLAEGSQRLDKTLSSEAFAYKDSVSLLVKNHILKSSVADVGGKLDQNDKRLGGKYIDDVTQLWSCKIWKFLDELRSASAKLTGKLKPTDDTTTSPREWKLKDESDRYRVMYREGPVGTPFHTLCLDGTVDGDFTGALCVAWESPMFKEWWPQFAVPTFKIIESKWLRRIRVGEDVSLIRFKIPWPLAQREVVMSAFELEYLEEDLIVGIVESVPEAIDINENVHGFSAADLPAPSGNVRMEVKGGFVMQRTSKNQFFFRTIINLDMKLDFVPPWLINFISRQVASQGLKLYQKAVTAVSNGTGSGKAFEKPLRTGYMYDRIRSGFAAQNAENRDAHTNQEIVRPPAFKDSTKAKSSQVSIRRMGSSENNRVVPYPVKAEEIKEISVTSAIPADKRVQPQLERPSKSHEVRVVKEIRPDIAGSSKHVYAANKKSSRNDEEVREYDDPEVDWAINVLDKMILFTRSCAASPATTAESLDSQVESKRLGITKPDSRELLERKCRKPAWPVKEIQSCSIVAVKPALVANDIRGVDSIEPSISPGLQTAGGDAESSGMSGFWSASEIEIVSSQDDTDTDVGASGSIAPSHLKMEEPEVEIKRRRRRWRWTCFSPSYSRKHAPQGKTNFYTQESGRASEVNWKSLTRDSSRFITSRGYTTDGEDRTVARQRLESEGQSAGVVTLGELLMDVNQ